MKRCAPNCPNLIACLASHEDLIVVICSQCKRIPFKVTHRSKLEERSTPSYYHNLGVNIQQALGSTSSNFRNTAVLAIGYCPRATWFVYGHDDTVPCPGCLINENSKKYVATKASWQGRKLPCTKSKMTRQRPNYQRNR